MAITQPANTSRLTWSPSFASSRNAQFQRAQAFIDSEVLRLCSPLTPLKTGTLIKSGTLGTRIGSGEVNYIAPYAHTQYYNTADTRSYDPRRGGHWFERMKAAHKDEILEGAKRV